MYTPRQAAPALVSAPFSLHSDSIHAASRWSQCLRTGIPAQPEFPALDDEDPIVQSARGIGPVVPEERDGAI